MKEYILELLRNGMWVFPIKGKGETIEEAKRPMTFKEGDEIITWKNEKIQAFSEELARKGHEAWALWLLKSRRFGIDIDLYKAREELNQDIIEPLMNLKEIYSEKSARGGVHIVLAAPSGKKYKLLTDKPWLEYKHDGYFIIAPSVLKTPEGEYRYTRIAGNILETATVNEWEFYRDLILPGVPAEIVEETQASIYNKDIESGKLVIEGLKLPIDELSNEQITALLYLLFSEADCPGMARLLEWIGEHGIAPIRKQMYNLMSIPRTTRWLTFYTLAAVLAWLGASEQRAVQWLRSWKFVDEDDEPVKDSLHNALYNVYHRQDLLLVPRGACPFCTILLNKESCWDTPLHRILTLPPEKIRQILVFVKRHVKKVR